MRIAASIQTRAGKAWNILVAFLFTFNMLFGAVPQVSAQPVDQPKDQLASQPAPQPAPKLVEFRPDTSALAALTDCLNDSDGANDVPNQKDLTRVCTDPSSINPLNISWNWDEILMSGKNSADACALFDTNNNGLADYSLCASWDDTRHMQAGYPILYSCRDDNADKCMDSTPVTIQHGTTCSISLGTDDPFPGDTAYPQDAVATCSINLDDVGGSTQSALIDVCSYPSAQPNSDPSDCVIISLARGNLEAIKDVVPDDPNTNWVMSWTGFSGTIAGDGTTGIQTVNKGTYTVTEAAGANTDLSLYDTTWACTTNGSASGSGSGTTISGVSVAKGGDVAICKFTNTRKSGTLEVKKDVVPDDSSTSWNFDFTGPSTLTTCTVTGDGTCGAQSVFTGDYTITESGASLSSYSTSWACTVNGSAGASGTGATASVTVNKNDVVVCTFTNSQKPGTLTVNKVLVPANDPGKFNLQIDGATKAADVGDGGSTGAVEVSAGAHTVGETAGAGTDLNNYVTTLGGDCDSSGNVTVQSNESKTCTITNTRKGNIVIKKVTDPAGQAGDFTFTGAVSGTIQDGGTLTASNLAPGAYSVTEATLAGNFALEAITCDDTNSTGDVATKKASITLDPGETVTCTFTNKKLTPDLAVTKEVDASPVNAGDAVGFTITVKNNGQGTATNVILSDTLPVAGVSDWAMAPANPDCTLTGASLSCGFGNLAPGASASVHITGTTTANSCGSYTNTATAQADNNGPVDGKADITVDCATLKIVKTADSGTVSAGDPISYTLTVTNTGSGTARNVVVTDNLPTNTGLNWSYPGSCTLSGQLLTCNLGDIASGGSKSVTITSPTTAATCGKVENQASVTSGNDGSDTSTVVSITVQCPSLSVTKTPDADPVSAGDTVGFTITVENTGAGAAKGVEINDPLPAGLTWTVDAAQTTATGCTIASGTLTCGPDNIASGSSIKVHVTATSTPAACGSISNTATATPTNGSAASGSATLTINCPDLIVTKTGNGPISASEDAVYTITVKNIGLGEARGVTLTDSLPGGLTWAIVPADTTASGCQINSSTLTCGPDTLAAGASIKVTFSAVTTAANCSTISNSASASATNEANTSNNSSGDVPLEIDCATIEIEKTTDTAVVSAGDTVRYTIKVTNPGSGMAKDVTVSDSLPGELSWSIDTAHSDTGCSISGSTLSCIFGSLASGGSKKVTITASTAAINCGTIINAATVTTSNDGTATSPDIDITIQCPNLSVTKAPDADSVSAGDTVGFVITVSNAGLGEAKGVTISDSLPGGLNWTVDPSGTTATGCKIVGAALTCGPDTIANGHNITVHVTATSTPDVCGTLSNNATATPTNGMAVTSDLATTTVNCPDLTVTKVGNGPISAGDDAIYSITVKNIGLGVAKGVTLTDSLPGGLAWTIVPADTTATGCQITGTTPQVLTCGPDALAAGASLKVTVSAVTSKDNCGDLTNSASASATNEANTSNNVSDDVDLEIDCASVEIVKTAGASTVSAGDPVSYTITVTNTGAGTAKDVTVTDELPGSLAWTIAPAVTGCTIDSGKLTCTFASLASKGKQVITVTAPTTASDCGPLTNKASVTTGNNGSVTTPEVTITVQCPALEVTKTADHATVSAGETIGFTITVTNTGDGVAKNVILSDTLQTGSGINWSIASSDPTCTLSGASLSCSFGNLAKGESKSVHVTSPTTKDSCTTYNNTATASADNQASVTTSQQASVEVLCTTITITKVADPGPFSAGDPIGFTIKVTNPGPGVAYGVKITDTLPTNSGLDWSISPAAAGCSIASGVLICEVGTLAAHGEFTVHIASPTNAATCGPVENTASVSTTNDGSGSAGDSLTVNCPDVSIEKTPDKDPFSAGDTIGFTIKVTNIGLGKAYGVTLTDTLPTNSGTDWSISPAVTGCSINSGALSCDVGTLNPGAEFSVHISSPTSPATCGSAVDNTATVTAGNEPAGQNNNSATASLTVDCPSLTVLKKADDAIVSAGSAIGFTITISNAGPGVAKNVNLTDPLPSGSGLSWSLDGGTGASYCQPIDNGVLTCNFGDLAKDATYTIHVTSSTDSTSCGSYPNTATVTSGNQQNVTGTDSVTVNCAAISITKTTTTPIVSAGDPISYTLTVTNSGDGTAHDVTVVDILPVTTGLGWTVNPAVQGCSVTSNVLSCNLGDLAGHTSQTITLTSPTTYDSCGTHNNTASVTTGNDGSGNSLTVPITVQCPDLKVTKTADHDTVSAGETIGFIITVTNTGDGVAKNVTLSDFLPAGTGISWSIASADPICTLNGVSLSCSFGDLAKGESKSVHVTSPTTKDSCTTYPNTAAASASNQPTVASPEASVTVQCSTIQIEKTADTGMVSAGDKVGFTIKVSNPGPATIYGVTVTDTLPTNAGLTWTIDPAVPGCSIDSGVLTCNVGTLAAKANFTVHISSPTTAATCGTVENTASVSTSNDGSGQAGDSITVNCPDLAVTKTAVPGSVSAGDPITFTITVNNTGDGTAKNVMLSDQLPLGTIWSVNNSGCSVDANNLLTCNFGDLAHGDSASVTVTGNSTPAMCSTFDNTATVRMDNGPDTESNKVSVTVKCPDITVTKEAVSDTINAGDTAAFKIVVKNIGTGTAKVVTLSDTLPAGVTWTIDPAVTACAIINNQLSCAWDSLAAGADVTINISGKTSPTFCATLDNTVTVAASNEAAGQTNNHSSATITVNCADVTVTKVALSDTINAGDVAGFKIVASNPGPGTAYAVTLSDTLPAGISWTLDPAVTGCSITGGVLECSWDSLASGAQVEIVVKGSAPAAVCGPLTNKVTISAGNETNTGNNSATATITVNCADVTVTKEGNGPINAGDTATFKIVVKNDGAGTAYNVTVSDTLPGTINWTMAPDVTGCVITGNALACAFDTLAPGASVTITVSGATPPAVCGALDNTVTATASNETNPTNNTARASIAVNCADVQVVKTADKGTLNPGQDVAFTIVVSNVGASTANNVTLNDPLPTQLNWALVQPVPGCSITNKVLSCSWASLAPNAAITIQVKAANKCSAFCGTLSNTATVAASNDTNADNNSSTANVTVVCPQDLTVSKTVNPAFTRKFTWDIDKSVDKSLVKQIGGSATFNYAVYVKEKGYSDFDWVVTGKITISNPNSQMNIPLTGLTDWVDNGGTCQIKNFTPGAQVPAGGSLTYDYKCTYASQPTSYSGINRVKASWDRSASGTPNGYAYARVNFTFDTGAPGNPTNINKTITVNDTFNGTTKKLGTVTAVTTLPYTRKAFTYSRTIPVPSSGCKCYNNTARIVETGQTASLKVTVCGLSPIHTGAHTIGFWQNKNGQDLILNSCSTNCACKIAAWLRQFAPFQDLSATASCKTVASYVYNTMRVANSRGPSMNAMLKAQMLATALDVYFSDPALGGNKLNAPAPIGGVKINLTYICRESGSCGSVSAAFGGATSLTVMQMLEYAAGKSNSGGSVWYNNVKSTQELAKNAFDAINNERAFAP